MYPVYFTDFLLVLAPLWVVLLSLSWQSLRRRGLAYILTAGIFLVYLLVVINLTLFPLWMGTTQWQRSLLPMLKWLLPFRDLSSMLGASAAPGVMVLILIRNVLGNIGLFFPFGLLLPILQPLTWRGVLRSGLLASISIEGTQLAIAFLGGSVHVVSSDDILLNLTGVLLGYASFRLLRHGWANLTSPRTAAVPVPHSEFSGHPQQSLPLGVFEREVKTESATGKLREGNGY